MSLRPRCGPDPAAPAVMEPEDRLEEIASIFARGILRLHLARKRYDDAAALFERYPDHWLAAPAWAKVLLAYAADGEARASELLTEARERNTHVEQYLTGRKRRPRHRAGMYSPGDEAEAVYCADMLWDAWKAHPKAKKWLKEAWATSM